MNTKSIIAIASDHAGYSLKEAIKKQSFEVKKKKFIAAKEKRAHYLRKGEANQWKGLLGNKTLERITQSIGKTMQKLGYK